MCKTEKPKIAPTSTPPTPQAPATIDSPEIVGMTEEQRRKRLIANGMASTNVTGGLRDKPAIERKTLLGGV